MIINVTHGVRIVADSVCFELQVINSKEKWTGHGFFLTLKAALEKIPDKVVLTTAGEYNVRQMLYVLNKINEAIAHLEVDMNNRVKEQVDEQRKD